MLASAGARIVPETIAIGESVYLEGHSSGIAPEAWDSLRRTKVFLKAPITTPSGGGYKSRNVTRRCPELSCRFELAGGGHYAAKRCSWRGRSLAMSAGNWA